MDCNPRTLVGQHMSSVSAQQCNQDCQVCWSHAKLVQPVWGHFRVGRRQEEGGVRVTWRGGGAIKPDPHPTPGQHSHYLGHYKALRLAPAKQQVQGSPSTQLGLTLQKGEMRPLPHGELQCSPNMHWDAA